MKVDSSTSDVFIHNLNSILATLVESWERGDEKPDFTIDLLLSSCTSTVRFLVPDDFLKTLQHSISKLEVLKTRSFPCKIPFSIMNHGNLSMLYSKEGLYNLMWKELGLSAAIYLIWNLEKISQSVSLLIYKIMFFHLIYIKHLLCVIQTLRTQEQNNKYIMYSWSIFGEKCVKLQKWWIVSEREGYTSLIKWG